MSVDVYIKDNCPYCERAERLLTKRKVAYNRINVTNDQDGFAVMQDRAQGRNTVPQIFVGETHIGGADDLSMMPRADFMALIGQ
ncbi:glutaredoxin 3 [Aestuariispira ectoiniformans]|uniref:glutaredoxin 3 n=1 Tax=Aestuariispira ectoiniformans TaxID=2775080 RepID=UPI00223BEEC3|nr:glutaredoxin 3 [Aestuariispira ectoiniformans]